MSGNLRIAEAFDAAEAEDVEPLAATLDIEIDVEFAKKRFTVLHLREPKGKEIDAAERELNVTQPTPHHFRRYQLTMIARVAGVPMEVVGEVPISKLNRAWDFLARTLNYTQQTGET